MNSSIIDSNNIQEQSIQQQTEYDATFKISNWLSIPIYRVTSEYNKILSKKQEGKCVNINYNRIPFLRNYMKVKPKTDDINKSIFNLFMHFLKKTKTNELIGDTTWIDMFMKYRYHISAYKAILPDSFVYPTLSMMRTGYGFYIENNHGSINDFNRFVFDIMFHHWYIVNDFDEQSNTLPKYPFHAEFITNDTSIPMTIVHDRFVSNVRLIEWYNSVFRCLLLSNLVYDNFATLDSIKEYDAVMERLDTLIFGKEYSKRIND